MQKGAHHLPFLMTDSPIARWDAEELDQAKDDIEKMLASPGWQVLMELLDGAYRSLQGQLIYGGVKETSAEYARVLGQMAGFESAKAAAEAVVLKARERAAKAEAEMAGVT